MSARRPIMVYGFGSAVIPQVVHPNNTDPWVDFEATLLLRDTIRSIFDLAYIGVDIEFIRFPGARSDLYFATTCDLATPEGRLVERLMALGREGKTIRCSDALSILEREYRELGLPLPKKTKPDVLTTGYSRLIQHE
jgi:hypothetical protein